MIYEELRNLNSICARRQICFSETVSAMTKLGGVSDSINLDVCLVVRDMTIFASVKSQSTPNPTDYAQYSAITHLRRVFAVVGTVLFYSHFAKLTRVSNVIRCYCRFGNIPNLMAMNDRGVAAVCFVHQNTPF